MLRTAPLAVFCVLLFLIASCGGGDGPKGKDWSNAPLLDRAVDYCVKRAVCTDEKTSVAQCVEEMADLTAFGGQVPTRRDLEDLVELRGCYNRATTCEAVRACVGVPAGEELEVCDLELSASSCSQRLGVSTLKTCLPAPSGEGGVWVEIDCTRYGLVCGFDAENHPRCVGETCAPIDYPTRCDAESGDIAQCGGADPVTGQPRGNIVYEYACGALGLGCDQGLGDPETTEDDMFVCVGKGEECDPAEPASCDGTTLAACLPNIDDAGAADGTGNAASWDCASGAIHHGCDAETFRCAPSATTCDPALDNGSCDGDQLLVCVDGGLVTIDCREHAASDCQAGTPALCVE